MKPNFAWMMVAVLILSGCSPPPAIQYDMVDEVPIDWNLTPQQVTVAATEYCERTGVDCARLGPPSIVVDIQDGQRFWCLGYHANSRVHGDHFMLIVNDHTGAIEWVGGE